MTSHSRIVLLSAVALVLSACVGSCADPEAALRDTDPAPSLAEARSLMSKSRFSQAESRLVALLEMHPDDPQIEGLLAVCRHSLGQPEKALDHYWAVQRGSLEPLPPDASEEQTAARGLLVECEGLLVLLTNQERLKRKLPLLVPDVALARIARAHSEEMRDRNYFDHRSPVRQNRTILDRFRNGVKGARDYIIAENIARRYAVGLFSLAPTNMRKTHQEWMESPGHRGNILNRQLANLGVGIAANADGDYWVTQFFATYSTGTR